MSHLWAGTAPASSSRVRPQFLYLPLETGHFRLLRILSVAHDEITCDLRHYPIQAAPDYISLSYVWGSGEHDHSIIIQHTDLSISQHLYECIQAIASVLDRENLAGHFIWIDAVCIDQENLQEKGTQVPLIGDIYKGAEFVLVWFGNLHGGEKIGSWILNWCFLFDELENPPEQNEFSDVEEYLEQHAANTNALTNFEMLLTEVGIQAANLEALYRVISVLDTDLDHQRMQEVVCTFRNSARGKHLLPQDHDIWYSLFAFLNNPWWYRIWTIQEMRLANDAAAFTSDTAFGWNYLVFFRQRLCRSQAAGELYSGYHHVHAGRDMDFNSRVSLHMDSAGNHDTRNSHEFQRMLIAIRCYRAKVKKDYIYGLLGMVDDSILQQLTIDYSDATPPEVVFTQAVKVACGLRNAVGFWINLMQGYELVRKELTALPSWVPDFSSDVIGGPNAVNTFDTAFALTDSVQSRYRHLACMSFPESSSLVAMVRGLHVDCVEDAIGIALKPNLQDAEFILETIVDSQNVAWGPDMDQTLFQKLAGRDLYSWFCDMDAFLWPDQDLVENEPPPFVVSLLDGNGWGLSGYYYLLRDFVHFVHARSIKALAEVPIGYPTPDLYTDERQLRAIGLDLFKLRAAVGGRFVFRTERGRLGASYTRVEQGDAIVVIAGGGPSLHALSPDKKRYIAPHIIVDGLMGDALLDTLPVDENEWEDFHLH